MTLGVPSVSASPVNSGEPPSQLVLSDDQATIGQRCERGSRPASWCADLRRITIPRLEPLAFPRCSSAPDRRIRIAKPQAAPITERDVERCTSWFHILPAD
jgi:hypothetical protein